MFILFAISLYPSQVFCQVLFSSPLSNRIANYRISLELDTRQKLIVAQQELRWRNNTSYPAYELRFHLYLNAFKNMQSTFFKDSFWTPERLSQLPEGEFGSIDIRSMILNDDVDMTENIEFIRPDDKNDNDSTVIRVVLLKPVLPGQQIKLSIDFTAKLPRIFARTGTVNDFYMLGQWFPKIGVFENGRWNCHQFFSRSEFYADFGVYEVELTLPREYEVGSTGILINEIFGDSLKTLFFRAEDVHDFAITAWPRYLRDVRKIAGVEVILLYAPEHQGQVYRYFSVIEAGLRYTAEWLMPYPYPQLTLVDPPLYAPQAAGMEYPCFISCQSIWGIPESMKFLTEEVTIHEFAHQYFYGILASDEAEEPWMDEGFTSYATQKILAETYGLYTSLSTFFNVYIGAHDGQKKRYMNRPSRGIVVQPSWEFTRGNYGVNTYSKPMLILLTLEKYLGVPVMNRIIKAYLENWKFRHPRTRDFIEIVNEMAPENMNWFFKQALYDSCTLDYAVKSIDQSVNTSNDAEKEWYNNEVLITREGDFIIPTEIQSVFANGDTLYEKWNGQDSIYILEYPGPSPLVSVQVDPGQKLWLDMNWTNNSYTKKTQNITVYSHLKGLLKIYQQLLIALFFF